MSVRDDAEKALQRAETMASRVVNSKECAEITAQCGIGFALLYLADTIKDNAGKYDPPF